MDTKWKWGWVRVEPDYGSIADMVSPPRYQGAIDFIKIPVTESVWWHVAIVVQRSLHG